MAAVLILGFAVIPTLILNAVSFGWYMETPSHNLDNDRPEIRRESGSGLTWRFVACCAQLGPVLYHFDWLRYACQLRKLERQSVRSPERKRQMRMLSLRLLEADRDATLLRMFEAFSEAAPQMLIQLTLLGWAFFTQKEHSNYWVNWERRMDSEGNVIPFDVTHAPWYLLMSGSVLISLVSLTWALVSQHRSLRLARFDKQKLSITGCLLMSVWRFLTLAARLYFLGAFLAIWSHMAIIIMCVYHLALVMPFVLCCQSVDFGSHWLLKTLVVMMASFVNAFTPFNLAEGRTRYRYAYLYTIEFSEHLLITYLINMNQPAEAPFLHFSFYAFAVHSLGVCVMCVYYKYAHPNARSADTQRETDENLNNDIVRDRQTVEMVHLVQQQSPDYKGDVNRNEVNTAPATENGVQVNIECA